MSCTNSIWKQLVGSNEIRKDKGAPVPETERDLVLSGMIRDYHSELISEGQCKE